MIDAGVLHCEMRDSFFYNSRERKPKIDFLLKKMTPLPKSGIEFSFLCISNEYLNYSNLKYTSITVNNKQVWNANMDVILGNDDATLYSYFPWRENINIKSIPIDVTEVNQTDWLYGTPVENINKNNYEASVTLNHALANLHLSIKKGGYNGVGTVSSVTFLSEGIASKALFNAAKETPSFIEFENAGEPFTREISIKIDGEGIDIMFIPTGVTSDFKIFLTVDGRQFSASIADVLFESGYTYNCNLTLHDTAINMSDFSIIPWETNYYKESLQTSIYNASLDSYITLLYNIDNPGDYNIYSDYYSIVDAMIVDNNVIEPSEMVTFSSTGEHKIQIHLNSCILPDIFCYTNVKKIIIPNTITSIGDCAFSWCEELTELTIPNSVTTIGYGIIDGCYNLTSLKVMDGNTTYDSRNNCNAIMHTASNSLITGCSNTIIPDDCIQINEYAFNSCSGLTEITIPNSVTTIGDGALSWCEELTQLNLGDGVQTIGEGAFRNCSGLTEITIPNSVISIGNSLFEGCSQLAKVNLGNGVQTIGDGAFLYCEGLTSVTIPMSVINIGNGIIDGCYNLTSLKVMDGNTTYDSRNNCNAIMHTASNSLITGCSNTIIPDDCIQINEYAFNSCSGLTEITIPNSVTTIGDGAFGWCEGLTQLNLGNGVQTIGKEAFVLCAGLPSLIIPNSVITIDERAFSGCKGLTELTIPNSVTTIGEYAFSDCDGLAEIVFNNGGKTIGKYAFNQCSGLAQVDFGNGVQTIGDYAFYNCTGLNAVNIPSSVQSIGNWSFGYCESITELNISNDGILDIGERAFYECTGLSTVTIPNSVKTLGNGAFCGCNELAEVIIKDGIQNINNDTFSGCSSLTTITIPNSVTTIGHSSFYYCSSLMSVTIPNSVTKIEESAFEKCTQLTQVNLGNGLQTIEESAFRNCTALMQITLPKSVLMLGNYIFQDCSSLSIINSHAIVAPKIDYYTFKSINDGGVLNVPAGSETSYSTWMGKAFDYLGKYNWTLQAIL